MLAPVLPRLATPPLLPPPPHTHQVLNQFRLCLNSSFTTIFLKIPSYTQLSCQAYGDKLGVNHENAVGDAVVKFLRPADFTS